MHFDSTERAALAVDMENDLISGKHANFGCSSSGASYGMNRLVNGEIITFAKATPQSERNEQMNGLLVDDGGGADGNGDGCGSVATW